FPTRRSSDLQQYSSARQFCKVVDWMFWSCSPLKHDSFGRLPTCTTKDRLFGTLCSYMQMWLRQLLSLLALRTSMLMCWSERFSARLLLQFRECIFSPVPSCRVQPTPS